MKQFGLDGTEAFNLIAQGQQSGLDFSGELLDSINEYSVQFNKLGLSAEDMFNILDSGSQDGAFNLDKIGDAVKEFSVRAIDGSNTTIDGFTKLGLNADDMAKKFGTGGDTAKEAFSQITKAIGDMNDPVEQSIVGVDLFGTMWEDLGPKVVTQLGDIGDNFSATYDALNYIKDINFDNVGSAFQYIKRNIQTSILIPIGDEVLPRLNDFARWFGSNIPGIKENISSVTNTFLSIGSSIVDNVFPSVKNLGGSIYNLATTIYDNVVPAFSSVTPDNWNSVGDAVSGIVNEATNAVDFVNDNWPTIQAIVEGITGAVIAWKLAIIGVNTWAGITTFATSAWETIEMMIWGIKNATTAWEAAQWLLNVAMDANPIGVVTLAIAGLALGIYELVKHFKEICEWVKKAWDWLNKWNSTSIEDKHATVGVDQIVTGTDENGNNFYADVGHNATGSQWWKGGWTTVSEGGRGELINLPSGSQIIPSNKTNKILDNNGGHVFNIYFSGNVGTDEFFNQAGTHIIGEIKKALINS